MRDRVTKGGSVALFPAHARDTAKRYNRRRTPRKSDRTSKSQDSAVARTPSPGLRQVHVFKYMHSRIYMYSTYMYSSICVRIHARTCIPSGGGALYAPPCTSHIPYVEHLHPCIHTYIPIKHPFSEKLLPLPHHRNSRKKDTH